jgi:alpha-glucosidase (family GH31 glycosyl hydrolase)
MTMWNSDIPAYKADTDPLYQTIPFFYGPSPKKMISDLARDGFKIPVIVDPGIKADSSYDAFRAGLAGGDFLRYPDGRLFIGRVWPGECAFPDFSRPETRRWWGEHFVALTSVGVRGFWNDVNEPSVFDTPTSTVDLSVVHYDNGLMTPHAKNHNVYGLLMTEGTYEGVRTLVPGERPFVLTRASYAGGQRYSAAWTGDNTSSWEHLAMAVPMLLNLSSSLPCSGPGRRSEKCVSQQLLQYSDQAPIDPLTLTFYPADSSGSIYYEDDGHTFRYQSGSCWKRAIE